MYSGHRPRTGSRSGQHTFISDSVRTEKPDGQIATVRAQIRAHTGKIRSGASHESHTRRGLRDRWMCIGGGGYFYSSFLQAEAKFCVSVSLQRSQFVQVERREINGAQQLL